MVYSEEYMDFFDDFYEALDQALGSDSEKIKIVEAETNNIIRASIFIHPNGSAIGMTVCPEPYFLQWKEGILLNDMVSALKDEISEMISEMAQLDFKEAFYNNALLRTSIVNYENNKTWLKDIPHERIADLALFTKLNLGGGLSVKVNQRLLAEMQLTKEEAFKIAKSNTADQKSLLTISQAMAEMVRENDGPEEMAWMMEAEAEHDILWVLQTKGGMNGAALIADPVVMKDIQERFPEGFYILPSTIHEVLIAPKERCHGMDVEDLKELVLFVNQKEVPIEDRLSDNVYEFDGCGLKIAGQAETIDREMPILDSGIRHRR